MPKRNTRTFPKPDVYFDVQVETNLQLLEDSPLPGNQNTYENRVYPSLITSKLNIAAIVSLKKHKSGKLNETVKKWDTHYGICRFKKKEFQSQSSKREFTVSVCLNWLLTFYDKFFLNTRLCATTLAKQNETCTKSKHSLRIIGR